MSHFAFAAHENVTASAASKTFPPEQNPQDLRIKKENNNYRNKVGCLLEPNSQNPSPSSHSVLNMLNLPADQVDIDMIHSSKLDSNVSKYTSKSALDSSVRSASPLNLSNYDSSDEFNSNHVKFLNLSSSGEKLDSSTSGFQDETFSSRSNSPLEKSDSLIIKSDSSNYIETSGTDRRRSRLAFSIDKIMEPSPKKSKLVSCFKIFYVHTLCFNPKGLDICFYKTQTPE